MKPREVVYRVKCYRGLVEALRARVNELQAVYEFDPVAGLPPQYSPEVILGPKGGRSLASINLGSLLAVLGLEIQLVIDEENFAKIRPRLEQRQWHATAKPKNVDADKLTALRAYLKGCSSRSDWGRALRACATANQSPAQRSRLARNAARARWARRPPAAAQPVPASVSVAGGQETP
jgi:hypothetical protein